MSAPNGYNPMNHKCAEKGCFNELYRPKIEVFAECLPGRIGFGDVDAEVEIRGYGLKLEWKSHAGSLPKGQDIMFKNKTYYGIDTVICVHGDAKTMAVYEIGFYWLGAWTGWQPSSLDELKDIIKSWASWAQREPSMTTIYGIMKCLLRRHESRRVFEFLSSQASAKTQPVEAA
jgi:hypothetical protein